MAVDESLKKLDKIFDQNVEITGTLTVGGNSVLTSIPSEYLTQTEGDTRYLQSFDITTQTDPKYLRSDTVDVIAGSFGTNEILKFQNNSSGDHIQIGFQQNDTDGLHHRAYFKTYKSDAGLAAGKFDLIVRSAGGGTTGDVLELEAGENAKWRGNVILDSNNISSYAITSLNATLSRFAENSWAGASGYPGYTFSGGNTRFGLSSTSGVLDLYVDGNFYATDSAHLVIHAGNIGSQSVNYANSAGSASTADSSGYSSSLYRYDNRTISPSEYPAGRMTFGFTSFNNNNTSPWADFIHLRGYTDNSGGADNMLVFSKSDLAMRLYQQTYGSSSAYSTYVDVITSGNIGSQSVSNSDTVDGYHASGFVRIGEPTFSANTAEDTSGPIEFVRDTGAGWDDYIIKHGPTKGMFGKKGVGWHADSSSSFHVMSSGWVSNFGVDSDGTTISRTSSRAPVFYDYNDSNYYLDPNSSSVLNNLNVNGYIHVSRNNTTGNGIILADDGDIVDLNDAYLSMRFSYGVRIYSANRGGSVRHTLHSDGNAYFNTSARSPIFYDNNDTNYYIDPNSTSNLNAANFGKIGGFKAAAFSDFYVYGDQNTYYPVIIGGGAHFGFHEYSISRGYSWTAPWDPIGTGSHKGGLTFNFYWSGDTAWGGNDHHIRVKHFSEQYTTMVAGLALPVTGGICVWLRGGGSGGAQYRLHAPGGHNHTPTVYDGASMSGHSTSTTFTAANGATFSPRTDTSNVNGEINARWPVRGNNEVVAGNLYCGYANFSGTSDLRKTNIVASGSGWYDGLNLISVDGSNTWNLLVDNGAADMFRVAYNSSEKFRIQTNGEVYTIGTGLAGSDYRAPIFYDSNNTGYYLDPASNSYLYGLFIGDNAGSNQKIDIRYGNYNTGYGAIRFHQAGSNNQTIHAFSTSWQGGSFPSASAGAINITGANGVTFGGWNNPDAWIDTSGNISARVAMFANTYYDRNNTNYYLNPDGGSNINTLDTGDTLINHTRGGRIGFTASGNHTDGFPYARIGEAWGVNMSPPDSRWAPSVTNASFLVGSISGGANYGIGNIRATGDIIAYASDKRLKRNIKPITNALNKVINMNGVYYDWDLELCNKFDFYPPEKTEAGVLAQEVKEVFPEVVQQAPFDCDADENGNVISKSGETYLTVKYEKLVPLLIEAVKELSNKVEELENQLKQKS